jgi:DNA-binding NarL/FixJ family response regulator
MSEPVKKTDPSQTMTRIAIVEDETWMRDDLVRKINAVPGFHCVNDYRTAEEALEGIPADEPDVVLMDINLPGIDGVECVRRLRVNLPQVKYIMLTVYSESERIFDSLLAGASGYLLKRTNTAELLDAIQQVRNGGAPMSSSIARKVVDYFNEMGEQKTHTPSLSPREQQVLELLAKGAAYKKIADQLSLSIDTIRMHVKHIYAKLYVHTRSEATAKYQQKSLFRRS